MASNPLFNPGVDATPPWNIRNTFHGYGSGISGTPLPLWNFNKNLRRGNNFRAGSGHTTGSDDTRNQTGFICDNNGSNVSNPKSGNEIEVDTPTFSKVPLNPTTSQYQFPTQLPAQFSSSFISPMDPPPRPSLMPYTYITPNIAHTLYTSPGGADPITTTLSPVENATYKQGSSMITGVSANYKGNRYLKANQPANIPDELNTSVWITNLPPNLDHKMLLDSVRNCGKVWAAVVNGPEKDHITAASKLVFFDVAGAENLLRQSLMGEFVVGGHIPQVRRNRIKTAAKGPCQHSRVLHIEGPSCIVEQQYLAALFRSNGIIWQDEVVLELSGNQTLTRLEWRFGSFRCQAESAKKLIERKKKDWKEMAEMTQTEWLLWQSVTVHFGVDPCAPKPDMQQTSANYGAHMNSVSSPVRDQPSGLESVPYGNTLSLRPYYDRNPSYRSCLR
ncbi:hypothetical protein F5Y19DRAFT_471889 [Xylariaceae sp. FL1651]|nr:hypothetical protein F5Y19DRAFT_471889 [Xylariaceae sp. FL1651]